jgi:hypothetical protein
MSDPFEEFGGWPTYVPPKSAVSALVQMPAHLIDGYRLADAYMRDERKARKAGRATLQERANG